MSPEIEKVVARVECNECGNTQWVDAIRISSGDNASIDVLEGQSCTGCGTPFESYDDDAFTLISIETA